MARGGLGEAFGTGVDCKVLGGLGSCRTDACDRWVSCESMSQAENLKSKFNLNIEFEIYEAPQLMKLAIRETKNENVPK